VNAHLRFVDSSSLLERSLLLFIMSIPAHEVVHPYVLSVAVTLLTIGGLYCCYHVLREIFLFAMVRIYKARGRVLPRYGLALRIGSSSVFSLVERL
jgi:hypothetical protein